MGRYTIEISKEALTDLLKIKKSGKKTDISKIQKIFLELETHPTIGIGKPDRADLNKLFSLTLARKSFPCPSTQAKNSLQL